MARHENDRSGALRGYLLGLLLIAGGAGLADWSGSLLPLALTGSAALMLTVTLVRRIARRARSRRP